MNGFGAPQSNSYLGVPSESGYSTIGRSPKSPKDYSKNFSNDLSSYKTNKGGISTLDFSINSYKKNRSKIEILIISFSYA